ncbi:protein enabled isoform X1 [Drosophila eugracilis]|uniref:protein enabled isoform X1 n=1 Tax=Drosophila eugracilis TaxID=29029 RepID=UPI0007E6CFAA|nr:protein enabled isoform X1 [Drosophila eugracilis]
MSCISSNFSSFFLNSLNDPSEFSKYLSNGELKCTNFEEFQVFGCGAGAPTQQQQQQQQQQHQQYSHTHLPNGSAAASATDFPNYEVTTTSQRESTSSVNSGSSVNPAHYASGAASASANIEASVAAAPTSNPGAGAAGSTPLTATPPSNRWPTAVATPNGHQGTASAPGSVPQHFDGSFEFIKYLRHSTDFTPSTASSASETSSCPEKTGNGKPGIPAGTTPPPPAQSPVASGLIDLDTSTSQKSRSASRKVAALLSSVSRASNSLVDTSTSALDVFDHDSKQTIFDLQHMASNGSSNSNESSLEMLAFPNSHLNASNSNTSSEGAACGSAGEFGGLLTGASCSSSTASSSSHAPKLLGSFVIKENFEVHPSHKVEEGIFQHMNKLPSKKKDTLKQLGVRFTGQMTLTDKSIVVENFIKFCEEYDIKDHRPWLSLNQCGLNKPEQIKFARYLGQGLPTFTLFCIYSNFKNLFCTKRTEIYTKDGYNLPYILDKTKRFLANTTAGDNPNNNITNNTSNKTNNNTSTTTTSTPVKQTPQQQPLQQQQSEQELLAPNSPATPKLAAVSATAAATATPTAATSAAGAVTPTQTVPRTRPSTPTMPTGAGALTPTTPQQQHLQQQLHHQQQQQHQQQLMLQHPHTHPHPHAQHSHPHTLPHNTHPHHLQPGTPTRSTHPQLSHPHHYPPSPHSHPHHQAGHHGHPHAHHFAYGHGHPHPQQHHPHYYPHPHAHVQHMAAMGYPGPPQSAQQAAGGVGGGGISAGGSGATGGVGSAGGGGLPPTAM